ncbi:AAA family ATPase [Laspinema olomoucense]|uniref:AAA family ATPase n=1 Tax=Laspinema olomoucense TaxID=3231600 RepID=UPI0021BB5D19|nr:ATP-binding protein [Laspinema sp. D3d]MCT7972064.1 AAA family ATPase [Laspinema sp. D3d]
MFKTIAIENFRGFQSFKLENLGRINLLVGENNSGKTSILEAVEVLCSRGTVETLIKVMNRRGEYLEGEEDGLNQRERVFEIRHLFYGHEIEPNRVFSISGTTEDSTETLSGLVRFKNGPRDPEPPGGYQAYPLNDLALLDKLALLIDEGNELEFQLKWHRAQESEQRKISLLFSGGLPVNPIRYGTRRLRDLETPKSRIQFVNSSSLTTEKMIDLFEQLVLNPEEKLVQEALQIVEPRIERIASVRSRINRNSDSRGGFVVRLSDSDRRIPIGSMGDGIWRILGIALATICAEGGVLLIDEIDTGLHFRALSKMWEMIWKTAIRLNVQVFATTHNSDCWMSLATIANQESSAKHGIRIHRIERGKNTSVVFTDREIVVAAERGFEVR